MPVHERTAGGEKTTERWDWPAAAGSVRLAWHYVLVQRKGQCLALNTAYYYMPGTSYGIGIGF